MCALYLFQTDLISNTYICAYILKCGINYTNLKENFTIHFEFHISWGCSVRLECAKILE